MKIIKRQAVPRAQHGRGERMKVIGEDGIERLGQGVCLASA